MPIHTYKHTSKGWKFNKTITTEAKARKSPGSVPSVTTVLGILKDDFLHGIWVPQQAVKLAREMLLAPKDGCVAWKYNIEDIPQAIYGFRTCPETGEQITSSSFGTNAHAFMEEWANCLIEGAEPDYSHPYAGVCKDAIAKLERIGTPVYAELLVGSLEDESCGALDLVAEVDGELHLVDFKFRSCRGGKAKFYDKDCDQLSIEAEWLQAEKNLDYLPKITSICIDSDTGSATFKTWTTENQAAGAHRWRCCRALYKAVHKF